MDDLPLISVVTPSYNQAKYLEETILSVLNQDYPFIEYIVCDGSSTDGSVDIIREYDDQLAYWVSEKDEGQADAINKGFHYSKGQILAWLNSDDLYTSDALSYVAEYFVQHPDVDMIYGEVERIDENGEFLGLSGTREYSFKELLSCRLVIPQQAVFFRRHCFEDVNGLDVGLFHAMDFNLWVKIGMQFNIRHVKQILARYRIHSDAKSVAQAFTVGPEIIKTLDWVFAGSDLPRNIRAAQDEIYGNALVVSGTGYYASLYLSKARADFLRAIWLNPLNLWKSQAFSLLLRTFLGKRILAFLRSWKRKRWVRTSQPM